MYCIYLYPSEFPIRSGCLSALLAADAKPQPNAFTSAAMPEHFTYSTNIHMQNNITIKFL